MAHIVIDARPITSSTGRYLRKLIENLAEIDRRNRYTILVWPDFDAESLAVADNFKFQVADYPITGSIREQTGLLRLLNKLKPDLVHFGMTQQPVFYKGKTVTTIHDLTPLHFKNPVNNSLLYMAKQRLYGRVVKRVGARSAAIITPSNYVKNDVVKYSGADPHKIFVTYEAADPITSAAQPLHRLQDKEFIMYVGRATPHKNLSRLVEAYVALKEKHPQLMLVLAGRIDENYRHLEARVTNRRLADSIVFTDFITDEELKWLYQNTSAYVFPSLSEGFGLPGLEAMIHGAPVVSSNATCLPEIYGDAAHYFDPANVFDMTNKINEVLSSAGLRGELIRKGRLQAAKYSWRKTATITLKIYKSLLD